MRNILKALFIIPALILVVVVLGGVFSGKERSTKKHPRPTIGEPARDFAYPDLNGKTVRLSDFFGKKVIFLNIWATWCTSCRKELPTVQKMYEKFKGDDFEVIAVSIDALGKKAVEPFMRKYGLTFPALLDISGSIQLLYGTTGVPETFIIDKSGKVAYVEIGAGDWTDPEKQSIIQSLMSEPDREVTR
ncbi:MAG TPA: TlpA family protein disulfide reductase [Nitrospirae bacterium]|nr:TlpA family protein disulfide reductase [Nitrospirota bacterium]